MLNTQNKPDPFAVLRIRDFISFSLARFFLTLGIQMQSTIVGWQVYQITEDSFALGLTGLAEIIPFLIIVLFAGHLAEIINRKKIIAFSIALYAICACALFYFSFNSSTIIQTYGVMPIYLTLFFTGIARAFMSPSFFALLSQLVPKELFGNASTWNSVVWQVAAVAGPSLGGLLCDFFELTVAYGVVITSIALSILSILMVSSKPLVPNNKKEPIFLSIATGIRFVFNNKIMLGAISLDLFAVLFGGAIALLPVFVHEVLHMGSGVFGILRSAPAAGAVMMAIVMAYIPPLKHAGRNLLLAVLGFGVSILVFAASTNIYLTAFALFMSGAFDNISVVIRHTILQVMTPDDMRGRVSSVNSIFIGSSNEIGEFESGSMAKLMGLVPSVIFGGTMTILIVGFVYKAVPPLRRLDLSGK